MNIENTIEKEPLTLGELMETTDSSARNYNVWQRKRSIKKIAHRRHRKQSGAHNTKFSGAQHTDSRTPRLKQPKIQWRTACRQSNTVADTTRT